MGHNKKVLVLTHNYPRWEDDYSGVFLKELVKHFCSDQISVYVIAPHFKGAAKFESSDYLEVHRFRYAPSGAETIAYAGNMHKQVFSPIGFLKFTFMMIAFTFKSIEVINREKPDLIFAQWLIPSGLVGWVASVFSRKRLYVTSHGTDIALLKKSGLMRFLAKRIYKRSQRAFTVSNYLKETVLDLDLALPEKIEVCPMPSRTDIFGKQSVAEQSPPLVLSVARFTKQKQLDVLIKALKILKDQNIEFVCQIYGEGECEAELNALINQLGLTEIVSLKPPVSQVELSRIYPAARITVLPSINEGFGMTLVEAQLSGSAVIGARSGGITDIIRDQQTGLLFEPGNAQQLASRIQAILLDDQLFHHLIKTAKAEAETKFSPHAIALKYETLLGLSPNN